MTSTHGDVPSRPSRTNFLQQRLLNPFRLTYFAKHFCDDTSIQNSHYINCDTHNVQINFLYPTYWSSNVVNSMHTTH